MTDEELIARWDDYVESMGSVMGEVEHMAQQMRNRIEALVKEQNYWIERCGRERAFASSHRVRAERLEAVLRELIDHTHNCEKELTERLYRADFCGESLPLTNARAAMKGADHE